MRQSVLTSIQRVDELNNGIDVTHEGDLELKNQINQGLKIVSNMM